jgi:hypothetical protein
MLLGDGSMTGTMLVDPKFLQSPHVITPGQRFYFLEIDGAPVTDPGPGTGTGHESAFYYVLDCPQRFSSMTFYLSEEDAQAIARHLRTGNKTKAGIEISKVWLRVAVREIMQGGDDTVDIRKEAIEIEHILPVVLRPIVMKLLRWFAGAIATWIVNAIVNRFAQEFIRLADDSQEGVTFKLTWRNPAGIDIVCRLLNSQNVSLEDFTKAFKDFLRNHVNNLPDPEIKAGYHRD